MVMSSALRAYMERNKKKQPRNVAGQEPNRYPTYTNVAEEITPETPQGRYQPFAGSEASRGTFGTPSGFGELDPASQEIRDFHKKQVRSKPRNAPTRPSGRSIAQANAEAQDPIYLSNTGQRRVDPATLERERIHREETAKRNALANARSKARIPTRPVTEPVTEPVTRSEGLANRTPVERPIDNRPVTNPLAGTKFSQYAGGEKSGQEPSLWDDFVDFFSSDGKGMLSDKEKKRRKKVKSGGIAGGKGR